MEATRATGELYWSTLPSNVFERVCTYLAHPFSILPLQRVCRKWQAEVLNLSILHNEEVWKKVFFSTSLPRVGMGRVDIPTWRLLVFVHRHWRQAKSFIPLDIPQEETFLYVVSEGVTLWRNKQGQLFLRNGAEAKLLFHFIYHQLHRLGEGFLAISKDCREIGFWSPTGCHSRSRSKFPGFVLETAASFGTECSDPPTSSKTGKAFDQRGRLWIEQNKSITIWQRGDPLPRLYKEGVDRIYVGYEKGLIRVFDKVKGRCQGEIALPPTTPIQFFALTNDFLFVGVTGDTRESDLHILHKTLQLHRSINHVVTCKTIGKSLRVHYFSSCMRQEEFPHVFPNFSPPVDFANLKVPDLELSTRIYTPTSIFAQNQLNGDLVLIKPKELKVERDSEHARVLQHAYYHETYLGLHWSDQKVEIIHTTTGQSHFIPLAHDPCSLLEMGKKGLLLISTGEMVRYCDLSTGATYDWHKKECVEDWCHDTLNKKIYILFREGSLHVVDQASGSSLRVSRGFAPAPNCRLSLVYKPGTPTLLIYECLKDASAVRDAFRIGLFDLHTGELKVQQRKPRNPQDFAYQLSSAGDSLLEMGHIEETQYWEILPIDSSEESFFYKHVRGEVLWFSKKDLLLFNNRGLFSYKNATNHLPEIVHGFSDVQRCVIQTLDLPNEFYVKILEQTHTQETKWYCYDKEQKLISSKAPSETITPQNAAQPMKFSDNKWEWEWKGQKYKFQDRSLTLPTDEIIPIPFQEKVNQVHCMDTKLFLVTSKDHLYCFDLKTRQLTYICDRCNVVNCLGQLLQVSTQFNPHDVRYFQISLEH